ncbi:phage minor tail protein L [Acinetobacter soli]|uniref:phage minor tail protein L n=1 Tax=Acinetobacter soli TaxID=487316 RepID=UPI004057709A
MSLNSDFQKLYVDGLITLYELDASNLGAGILRFHGHISHQDWERISLTLSEFGNTRSVSLSGIPEIISDKSYALVSSDNEFNYAYGNSRPDSQTSMIDSSLMLDGQFGKLWAWNNISKDWKRDIIWQGQVFEPMALQVDGLEMNATGKASSPSLSLANNINGIQGAVSAYCLQFEDFAGAKLKVIRTLAKYLDAENFSNGNPSADSNQAKTQIWYIEQKTSENSQTVTFELSNPVDFEGLKIPVRNITGYCTWCINGDYRGEECQYTGLRYFDEKDQPTDDPSKDKCSGRLIACKSRNNEENFGGFPASNLFG